jgi:hypothetical protein
MYEDGVQIGGTQSLFGKVLPVTPSTRDLDIGILGSAANASIHAKWDAIYIWNRELFASEVEQINEDPFLPFRLRPGGVVPLPPEPTVFRDYVLGDRSAQLAVLGDRRSELSVLGDRQARVASVQGNRLAATAVRGDRHAVSSVLGDRKVGG